MEKAVSCYKADQPVASTLSFHSIQSSLAVHEFILQGKNAANEAMDGYVRTFDVVAPKVQSQLCELSGPTFGFTMREFSMVGGYMENPEKPQNCQNWGVGTYSGHYGNGTRYIVMSQY